MGANHITNANKVFHIIIEDKPQLELGQIVETPFKTKRDYSHWKEYKQKAESVLENYRQEHYPLMPSRNDCLFVSADAEMNELWVRSKYSKGAIYYQYELEIIDGKPVYLDTDWFEGICELYSNGEICSTHKFSEEECLNGYWKGKPFRNNGGSLQEGLFYGRAKVISMKKFQYNRLQGTIIEIN